MELKTKTQNIFCFLNENLTTFLYTLSFTEATRKQSVYISRMLLKKIWVLVFGLMYLVLVDVMDKSQVCYVSDRTLVELWWNIGGA